MNNAALATRRTESISRGVGVTTQIYADRAENAEIWDVEGTLELARRSNIPLLADESVSTAHDLIAIIRTRAAKHFEPHRRRPLRLVGLQQTLERQFHLQAAVAPEPFDPDGGINRDHETGARRSPGAVQRRNRIRLILRHHRLRIIERAFPDQPAELPGFGPQHEFLDLAGRGLG